MAQLDLQAHIPAAVDLVYQVVADVERYPTFLSDVASVDKQGDMVAMTLRMGLVPVRLVTRAEFTPSRSIDLTQVEGPFRRFNARWTFTPRDDGTDVGYHADYELPLWTPLLAGPARLLLEHQTNRQIRGFESRVRALSTKQ
jgi:ribosome-associated toxin RatA of RatAB toxin-antitoxin module